MILDDAISIVQKKFLEAGMTTLSQIYPRDFEVYAFAIELVDFNDTLIDYFMFPVMPNSISKSENERTNVVKTLRSITVINSTAFVPKDLSISGTFGKSLKLIKDKAVSNVSEYSINSGVYSAEQVEDGTSSPITRINKYIRTGFGLVKDLQSIIDKAKSFDSAGKPFKLHIYNLALGETYLCALTKNPLTLKQDSSTSNMIWQYTLNLKIIADLNKISYSPKGRRILDIRHRVQNFMGNFVKRGELLADQADSLGYKAIYLIKKEALYKNLDAFGL